MNGISHLISPPVQLCRKLCGYSEVNLLVETQPLVETNVCTCAGSECQSAHEQLVIVSVFLAGTVRQRETCDLFCLCKIMQNSLASQCLFVVMGDFNALSYFKDKIERCFFCLFVFFPILSYFYVLV